MLDSAVENIGQKEVVTARWGITHRAEARMIKQFPIHCPVIAVDVRVTQHTYVISGIGSSHRITQRDYTCSQESTCLSGCTAACPIRKLNG